MRQHPMGWPCASSSPGGGVRVRTGPSGSISFAAEDAARPFLAETSRRGVLHPELRRASPSDAVS